jgi:hypothetical protein
MNKLASLWLCLQGNHAWLEWMELQNGRIADATRHCASCFWGFRCRSKKTGKVYKSFARLLEAEREGAQLGEERP